MARVLLAWELGGGAGHCVKLAPIAAGLIAKGHEVSAVVRDLLTARQVFGSARIDYLQAPYIAGRQPNMIAEIRSLAHILHNTGFGDDVSLEVLCGAWRNLINAVKPDVLICDHAPMALLASRWHTMRRVILGTGFTVPPPISPLPDLRYWMPNGASQDQLRRDEASILNRINALLARDGLAKLDRLIGLYADSDASFLLTFKELDHYPQRQGAQYWGLWAPSDGCMPEWPVDRPRIFAYLKPPTSTWRLGGFLAFLRESRLSSLVYVAGGDPDWLCKFQTPQLRFIGRPLDVVKAAKHCDLAILNGSAGSATAFLLAGVPQLNIPLYLEQIILSRRVAELGAGLYANAARPEQIAARLVAMLQTDHYRKSAQAFSEKYADFNPELAIDQIISLIQSLVTTER